jgi:beta-lactamase class A
MYGMRNLNTRYAYFQSPIRTNRRKSKLRNRVIIIGLIALAILFIVQTPRQVQTAFHFGAAATPSPSPSPIQDPNLATAIQPLIPTDNGDFAIVVRSLNDDTHNYFFQSTRPFPSASLYKLFLLAAAFREINQGTIDLDTTISADVDDLSERLGGVDFGYEDATGTISYPIESCLDRVARLSDNFCALMLADKIGWDTVQKEADILGASNTTIKSPITTTPADMSNFLQKLYQGQVVDATASAKIVQLMTTSHSKDRIPSLLPQELKIAHKTGELSRVRHDVGIIFLASNPYLIVMMSENLKGEDTAIDTMANISKVVYDYFAELP